MSQTVRIRDEDAQMIDKIREMTGLTSAEAAHYVISQDYGNPVEKCREQIKRDATLHPKWDSTDDEGRKMILNSIQYDSADTLLDPVAMPGFAPQEAES